MIHDEQWFEDNDSPDPRELARDYHEHMAIADVFALKKMTSQLNKLVGFCLDQGMSGNEINQSRGYLPSQYNNSFQSRK